MVLGFQLQTFFAYNLELIIELTWQTSADGQIWLPQAPATAPVTSKYVQFSADELPHPTETETD